MLGSLAELRGCSNSGGPASGPAGEVTHAKPEWTRNRAVFEAKMETGDDMRVINDTPFPELFFHWVKPDKSLALTAVVRASFMIPDRDDFDLEPSDFQPGPQLVDSWYGDPRHSSLRSEHDRIPYKPRGEIYFVDPISRSPDGLPSAEWLGSVEVGLSLRFRFKVFGPRTCRYGLLGQRTYVLAKKTTEVPLRYELMYGGQEQEDSANGYAMNPLGCGYIRKSGFDSKFNKAPQVVPFEGPVEQAPPSLTPVHRAWIPRRSYAGTLDQKWLDERWPLFPDDFSGDFYQQSPAHLQLPSGYFRGDELVDISEIGKRNRYRFQLPESRPLFHGTMNGSETSVHQMRLDTVIFDLEKSNLSLIWRTELPPSTPDTIHYISFEESEDV
jgi:hypothetical protein